MINRQVKNPCVRCGKERILLKQWVEEIPTFDNKTQKVTRALNVCPDPECQKLVAADIEAQRKKQEKVKLDRENKLKANAEKKKAILDALNS